MISVRWQGGSLLKLGRLEDWPVEVRPYLKALEAYRVEALGLRPLFKGVKRYDRILDQLRIQTRLAFDAAQAIKKCVRDESFEGLDKDMSQRGAELLVFLVSCERFTVDGLQADEQEPGTIECDLCHSGLALQQRVEQIALDLNKVLTRRHAK